MAESTSSTHEIPPRGNYNMAKKDPFRSPQKNATRIPHEVWEANKESIVHWYKDENKTLSQVMDLMKQEHGFIATRRQYVHALRGWGIVKYKKSPSRETPRETPTSDSASGRKSTRVYASTQDMPSRVAEGPRSLQINRQPVINTIVFQAPSLSGSTVRRSPTLGLQLYHPHLHSGDAVARHRLLAEMLLVLGYVDHAFDLSASLYEQEHVTAHLFTSVRTARTREQANRVCDMVNEYLKTWQDRDERSWMAVVIELALAHAYDRGAQADNNGIAQIQRLILKRIEPDEQNRERLERLTPRGPRFDVPAYVLLASALLRYNTCTDFDREEDLIDDIGVLKQFELQQPAFQHGRFDQVPDIDCHQSCIKWCIEVLPRAWSIQIDLPTNCRNELAETYELLCRLWYVMVLPRLSQGRPQPAASPSHDWASSVEQQLDISAIEVLAAVACMIMAKAAEMDDANGSLLDRALSGARSLDRLSSAKELFDRFLDQVLTINLKLMARPEDLRFLPLPVQGRTKVSPEEAASMLAPFHAFVARVLQVELPPLEQGAAVLLLVLASPNGSPQDDYFLPPLCDPALSLSAGGEGEDYMEGGDGGLQHRAGDDHHDGSFLWRPRRLAPGP